MIHRTISSRLLVACALLVLAATAFAEIPRMINWQGKVTDASGSPVADDSYTMRFRIYDAATVGNLEWDSDDRTVAVTGGVFSALSGEPVACVGVGVWRGSAAFGRVRRDQPGHGSGVWGGWAGVLPRGLCGLLFGHSCGHGQQELCGVDVEGADYVVLSGEPREPV